MNDRRLEPVFCLAVETSGSVGSAALGRGDAVVETTTFSAARRHAVELLPTVQRLCRRHNVPPQAVDEVYVSGGPGSFTGLRIGVTFAKTIALGCAARVVRVPTLEVIARNALAMDDPPTHLAVLLDAKRGRVYAAEFELLESAYRRTTEPAEVETSEFLDRLTPGTGLVGEGIAHHRDVVEASRLEILPATYNHARADVLYELGRRGAAAGHYENATALTPIYVRRPEAEEVYERRHAENRN